MKKLSERYENSKKKISELEFDVHWYRRVFHTFGASFLVFYMVPDVSWINILKFWIPLFIVITIIILEILRIKGKISSSHFFGLRMYEKNRIGSYLFFGIAILILLLFFPQQIAIPCILCACIADPIMGEIRFRFGKRFVYVIGFLVCLSLFLVTWYKSAMWVLILVSIIGATGAVIGETKKFWWLDDDFMIQILPAVLLLIIWFGFNLVDINILPETMIQPFTMPW